MKAIVLAYTVSLLLLAMLTPLEPTTVTAAPSPPALKTLTPEMLVGTWKYKWGDTWVNGIISFGEDGSYFAQHDPCSFNVYYGTWTVVGNILTLKEWSSCEGRPDNYLPREYRVTFKVDHYPYLVSEGVISKVVLSNPQRHDKENDK